jgi:hypothetical protein
MRNLRLCRFDFKRDTLSESTLCSIQTRAYVSW